MKIGAVLIAYAAGLAAAPFLLPSSYYLPAFLTAAVLFLPLRKTRAAPLVLTAALLFFGIWSYHLRISPPGRSDHIAAFASEDPVTVEGSVLSVASRPDGRWSIDMAAEKVGSRGIFAPVFGKLRLSVESEKTSARPGERLRFRSRLRRPRTYGTPGEFPYSRHLAARDIFVTAFVPDGDAMAVLAQSGPPPGPRLERWRQKVAENIDRSVSAETAPFVKALAVGDATGISRESRELLARSGLSHLFAISGLHMGLVGFFLFLLAQTLHTRSERLLLLAPPRRLLPPLLLPLLFVYLVLSGAALPARRAFLMAAAGVLLLLGGRRTRPLRLLTAAAFLVLLAEPLALFEPAFQLSFAGVAGILLLLPRWQTRLSTFPKAARLGIEVVLTTLAATIATAPFAWLHFHLFAPAALVSNLVAVPAVALGAVPLALAGTTATFFWPTAGDACFKLCAFIVELLLGMAQWVIDLPFLGGWRLYPSMTEFVAALFLALTLLVPGRSRRLHLTRCTLAVTAFFLFILPGRVRNELTVTALSVGQGESLLVTTPEGRNYLIDGGGSHDGRFDPGERLVAPALGRMGIRRLEAVVLTHEHPDHLQGLLHILENFQVRAFWSALPQDAFPAELEKILRSRHIRSVSFPPGWSTKEASATDVLALFCSPDAANPNDSSLVVYLRHGGDGALLTGDLEAEGVGRLLAAPLPGPVTLLKIPHHGSRKSDPRRLVEVLSPRLALVSAGFANRYGFPHPEVVSALQSQNIPLFRTDLDGTVRLRSKGAEWRGERWERGLFR